MARSQKTINRYVSIYNKIQAKHSLADVGKWSYSDFQRETGLTGQGQFNLARSLARNKDIQKELNITLKQKNIPRTWIKPIKVKEYMVPVKKVVSTLQYQSFTKPSTKFRSVKGLKTSISTDAINLKRDAKRALKEVYNKASRQKQAFSGKQIKISLTSNIVPNKKLDADFRETQTRSVQTKARMFTADLSDDLDDIYDAIDNYVAEYNPDGSINVAISIVNYTV